jgi:Skp family chaperone for outer membrane proteins
MRTGSAPVSLLARWFVVCVSVGIALLVAPATYGQKPPKIGVVNFQDVALQSKAGKAAKARLQEMADRVKKEVKAEEDKLIGHQKQLEAASARLTPAERQHRAEALEREEVALKRLMQDKTEELTKAETDSVIDLARKIEPVLNAYAAEKGYLLILEARRPGLLYYDKNLDLTAEIVKRFDQASK